MELQGKTALIPGGTAGIGPEAGKLMIREGATVLITGRNHDRGTQAVSELQADGGTARYIQSNLNDLDSVHALARQAGDVDILVNNAASFPTALTIDQDVETFEDMFDTNVHGAFFLTAALVPHMIAQHDGSIVTTMAAHLGVPQAAVYSATKAALASFTRTWVTEWSADGIRVNNLAPGPTATDGVIAVWGERIQELGGMLPFGRPGNPKEIAEAILFLASPRASFITGQTLHADGGRTAV